MNERIQELALKAFQPINGIASEGVADFYTFKQPWFQLYNQKFAELIVRECMCIADDMKALDVAAELERYFGVEE